MSNVILDRIAGLFILLIIPPLAIGLFFDPGLDTRSEYFSESFTQFVPDRNVFLVSIWLFIAAAIAMMVGGGALLLRFRHIELPSSMLSALGLVAAGLLVLGGAGAGLMVHDLAAEWLTESGAAADGIEASALTAQQLRFMLSGLGIVLLLICLISCGVTMQRLSELPYWLLRLPVVSGILLVASPLGFWSVGFFLFLIVSAMILFAWLIVVAGWWTIRGSAPSRLNTGQATP